MMQSFMKSLSGRETNHSDRDREDNYNYSPRNKRDVQRDVQRCFRCNDKGHFIRDCPYDSDDERLDRHVAFEESNS